MKTLCTIIISIFGLDSQWFWDILTQEEKSRIPRVLWKGPTVSRKPHREKVGYSLSDLPNWITHQQ